MNKSVHFFPAEVTPFSVKLSNVRVLVVPTEKMRFPSKRAALTVCAVSAGTSANSANM